VVEIAGVTARSQSVPMLHSHWATPVPIGDGTRSPPLRCQQRAPCIGARRPTTPREAKCDQTQTDPIPLAGQRSAPLSSSAIREASTWVRTSTSRRRATRTVSFLPAQEVHGRSRYASKAYLPRHGCRSTGLSRSLTTGKTIQTPG